MHQLTAACAPGTQPGGLDTQAPLLPPVGVASCRPLKAETIGMTGICQSEDPNVIQACLWSPAPAKGGHQKQRYSIFF